MKKLFVLAKELHILYISSNLPIINYILHLSSSLMANPNKRISHFIFIQRLFPWPADNIWNPCILLPDVHRPVCF